MPRCIIHTGLHKTGSSSLQNFLHVHSARLLEAGILYPKAGRHMQRTPAIQHQFLVRSATADPSNMHGDRPWRELEAEIAGTAHDTLLISAEFVGFQLFGGGDWTFPDGLRALGYEVSLLTWVRPQAELTVSKYTQRVKNFRATESFAQFAASVLPGRVHRYARMREETGARGVPCRFMPYDGAIREGGIERAGLAAILDLDGRLPEADRAALTDDLSGAVPPRRNEGTGAVELALCRAIAREINPDGRLSHSETQVLHNVVTSVLGRSWRYRDERYRMLDDTLAAQEAEVHGAANEAFARAEWNRGWTEVFGAPRTAPPNDPEVADRPDLARSFERHQGRVRRAVLRRLERRRAEIGAASG